MTTKENVGAKVLGLLDDIRPHLEKKLERLLDSGVIDFGNEPDNYALPKDIIQVLAREMAFQYAAPYPKRGYKKKLDKMFHAIRFNN